MIKFTEKETDLIISSLHFVSECTAVEEPKTANSCQNLIKKIEKEIN